MIIKTISPRSLFQFQQQAREKALPQKEVLESVSQILSAVKENQDEAVRRYTKIFDGYDPNPVQVSKKEQIEGANALSAPFRKSLEQAISKIRSFHENQKTASWKITTSPGEFMGQLILPLSSVALYAPGGKAAYPSSVLMGAIPAQIAGVKRIALFTPADQFGRVNKEVLGAAHILGIEEIYRIGGAQSIAAAAYGTPSIEPVDKIVGPGNVYVTEAKRQVYGIVDIDMIAGPSEVLIIADETANPQFIAADLLAQAEHDENAGLTLVSTCRDLFPAVEEALKLQLENLSRKEIASKSLSKAQGFFAENLPQAFRLSNAIAPEHLELHIKDFENHLEKVENAGSIFLGPYTPETLGDYLAGPNHTLPTGGAARYGSPLGVYDFIKRPSFLSFSKQALKDVSDALICFAQAEGLDGHAQAVRTRWIP